MNIRLAKIGDYDSIVALMNQMQELHAKLRPDIYKKSEDLYTKINFSKKVNDKSCFIAEDNGTIIGAMEIRIRSIYSLKQKSRKVIYIETLVVDQNYRRQGIGHKLIQKVFELKDINQLDSIELHVNALNTKAYDFCAEEGFIPKSINLEYINSFAM